jgi:CrcB protein
MQGLVDGGLIMSTFLAVGFGGFIGACLRYFTSTFINKIVPNFPVATLLVNVIAGLLIGLVIGYERNFTELPVTIKTFLTGGFLGGLSTFSTFSLETVNLLEKGKIPQMAINIIANVVLSIIFVVIGLEIIKCVGKRIG